MHVVINTKIYCFERVAEFAETIRELTKAGGRLPDVVHVDKVGEEYQLTLPNFERQKEKK